MSEPSTLVSTRRTAWELPQPPTEAKQLVERGLVSDRVADPHRGPVKLHFDRAIP